MATIKSKVVNLIPGDIFDKFKNGDVVLKRTIEIKEFQDHYYEYTPEDVLTLEEYFEYVKSDLKQVDDFRFNELEDKALHYAKNITFEQFKKVVFAERNEVICSIDPVTIDYSKYYRDGKEHKTTYTTLNAEDINAMLFHWSFTNDRPEVYFYEGSWTEIDSDVREFVNIKSNEKYVLVTRYEEC